MSANWIGTIPIYINNFIWLTAPRELAAWFDDVPGTEVILVDNASTYQPLLDWYATDCPYKVIRLDKNCGPHAPWTQGAVLPPVVHRGYFGSEYYVVTDPDLSLGSCPKDMLNVLVSGLQIHKEMHKAGLSLEIDDIPDAFPLAHEVREWEQGFWRHRRDERYFEAAVDTTFALYPIDAEQRSKSHSLRSDRPYTARHLPWYVTAANVTEEHRHYFGSSRSYERRVDLSNQLES